MNPSESHGESKRYQVEILQGPRDDAEWIEFGEPTDTPEEAGEFIARRLHPDAPVRIIETSSGLEYIDDGTRIYINDALANSDPGWAYHRILNDHYREAFDKLLIWFDHPLAREGASREQRFNRLHGMGYQFPLDDPSLRIGTVNVHQAEEQCCVFGGCGKPVGLWVQRPLHKFDTAESAKNRQRIGVCGIEHTEQSISEPGFDGKRMPFVRCDDASPKAPRMQM